MRFALALCALLFAVPASARSVLLEFDYTVADISVGGFPTGVDLDERDPVALTLHEFASLPSSGSVGIRVDRADFTFQELDDPPLPSFITCVYGALCPLITEDLQAPNFSPNAYRSQFADQDFNLVWETKGGVWFFGNGQAIWDNDFFSSVDQVIGGIRYAFDFQRIELGLSNERISEVPVPASVLFLLTGLLGLPAARVFRARRA